ncbi:major capsid protein [Blastococcus sp. SYSU DS0552]
MDRINELLGRIAELSHDELGELRGLILQQLDGLNTVPSQAHGTDSYAVMEVLASAADTVKRERDRREQAITAAFQARQALTAASAVPANVPADRRPPGWRATGEGAARAITASGMEIPNNDALAREFISAVHTVAATRDLGVDGEKVRVARLTTDRGPGRTLRRSDSAESVAAAVEAAAAEHVARVRQSITAAASDQPAAITAAGGFGAPRDVDYSLPGFEAEGARPVKAALPTYTSDRGGVRFVRPPQLASLNGAVGIWTVQNDIDAATNTAVRKPAIQVSPGGEVAVDTQAVTNTLIVGNLISRAYPEFVARITALASAAHDRIAEQQLLTQIGALSTAVSGTATEGQTDGVKPLGATRVLLPLLDRAATGMRNRLRMPSDAPLQLILPDWSRGILRSDLALQEPGDASLGVTDAELAAYLATRNLAPTYAMDGEAGQQFDVQSPGPVNAWPTSIVSYMFPAGAFVFLDSGTLDLGIVRDSTLTAANDMMLFSESFEAVMFRGGEAFRINQAVTPSGIAQAAVA